MTNDLRRLRVYVENACFCGLAFSMVLSLLSLMGSVLSHKHATKISASTISSGITLSMAAFVFVIIVLVLYNLLRFVEWRNSGYK